MKTTKPIVLLLSVFLLLTSCSQQNVSPDQKQISLSSLWETENVFLGPECVVYDPKRQFFYVSNVNVSEDANSKDLNFVEFISKVDSNGNVVELKWVDKVNRPTGMTIHNDQLYVTTRYELLIIDIETSKTTQRIPIPDADFPNDVAVDNNDVIYMTDSGNDTVYRIENGKVENWIVGDVVGKPNGIFYDEGKILIGVNLDNYLKSIDIKTKEIKKVAFLDEGEIDGITEYRDTYLVSHVKGNIYQVNKKGKVSELLNTREQGIRCADFGLAKDQKMIICPVINKDTLMAYKF